VGIGILKTNAGIGIPASVISVRYRNKQMPDCVYLFRYRTGCGIVSFFQSGTGLTKSVESQFSHYYAASTLGKNFRILCYVPFNKLVLMKYFPQNLNLFLNQKVTKIARALIFICYLRIPNCWTDHLTLKSG
jgi:hypothetical protein